VCDVLDFDKVVIQVRISKKKDKTMFAAISHDGGNEEVVAEMVIGRY